VCDNGSESDAAHDNPGSEGGKGSSAHIEILLDVKAIRTCARAGDAEIPIGAIGETPKSGADLPGGAVINAMLAARCSRTKRRRESCRQGVD
jgi:hypothetical protein